MSHSKILLTFLATFLVLVINASASEDALKKRIAPVGSVCIEGQDCANAVAVTISTNSSSRSGEQVYANACMTCHSIGLAGAPKFADATTWGVRPDKGLAALTMSVKNGLGGMPPKGLCMDCSDDELSLAVQHMLDSL
jgi:cytochrome c5